MYYDKTGEYVKNIFAIYLFTVCCVSKVCTALHILIYKYELASRRCNAQFAVPHDIMPLNRIK